MAFAASQPAPASGTALGAAILSHRKSRTGELEYLTAWKGCAELTWEPRSSFVLDDVAGVLQIAVPEMCAITIP